MGLTVAPRARYEGAIKKLFPQGAYWDGQFADPESDVSLFCQVKAEYLFRFRGRMSALQDESRIETTEELIADWERVLLDTELYGKTLEERRQLLTAKEDNQVNRIELRKTASLYSLTLLDIAFPCRPAFFGHARYTTSFLGGPACFSVLLVTAAWAVANYRALFFADHPVQRFGAAHFSRDRLAWLPASRLRYYRDKTLRAASAGFFKMGVQRLFSSPVYKIRPLVEVRLRTASAGFTCFGINRLVYSPVPATRWLVTGRVRGGSTGFMRTGRDRLMYTPVREIKMTVYDRIRAAGTGYARFGRSRLFSMPFFQIGVLLEEQFRVVSFGVVRFGQFRLACFSGEFSRSLVQSEPGLFTGFVKSVLRKSGVMARTDTQMVNAIIGNSTFLRQFDIALTQRLVRQSGLFPAFDNFFTQTLIQQNKFFPRLEKAFINYIAGAKALFSDFEQAVREKLLANQIPYFDYEGV